LPLQQAEIKLVVEVKMPDIVVRPDQIQEVATLHPCVPKGEHAAPAEHPASSLVLRELDKADSEGLIISFAGEPSDMNHTLDADWSRFFAKLFTAWHDFHSDGIIVDELIKCSPFRINGWAMIS
jgi:hypothetical protein